jgi:1,4-dihydroxy-2-naphthoate octaprenyltransferase
MLPQPVEELLDRALVGELTVVGPDGRAITYPLIPLYDGETVYLTSSALFSRKLEHIRSNPRVALSITDPVAVDGRTDRVTIQGDARVIEDDPHGGWERLLPIWEAKEPAIVAFLKQRVALPLFFERALIAITPRRVIYWPRGAASEAPTITATQARMDPTATAGRDTGAPSARTTSRLDARSGMSKLRRYPHHVLSWVAEDGYPMNVAVVAEIDPERLTATFERPAGLDVAMDGTVSLTGSHIRPQPGYGYDERRHVTVWGPASVLDGRLLVHGERAWGWDEQEVPFFEYSERSVGQSRRYFDALSAERGTPVKPRLSLGWLTLRATRLPFLSATIVPVLLGIVIAAAQGFFDLPTAILTVIGASLVQVGLNVANDVFDTTQGADDANVTPTKFSGGSRVIQYGLVSLRSMATIAFGAYLGAAAIGMMLLAMRGSAALLAIGVIGFIVSLGYTAPPLKLVYRGLGEAAVAVGFGPLMLLGAYVVQTAGAVSWEPVVASIPVALLVALILYVNEIPDRRGDARAGKRTLPVRFSRDTVLFGYDAAVVAAYAVVVGGVLAGLLPIPALLVLLTIPLARRVRDGLRPNYDSPYALMAVMATNIQLHLYVGLLLFGAYVAVLVARAVAPGLPLFVR